MAKSGRLFAGANFSLSETPVVLVVVTLDQIAVYHLFATARSGHILAEIRVWAAEITKHRERRFNDRFFLFHSHGVLKSARIGGPS
jgi:hypothetical protein